MTPLFVDPDIEKASTISAEFYTSPDWFERSKEKIFAKTWQFCMGTEEVQKPSFMILLPYFQD